MANIEEAIVIGKFKRNRFRVVLRAGNPVAIPEHRTQLSSMHRTRNLRRLPIAEEELLVSTHPRRIAGSAATLAGGLAANDARTSSKTRSGEIPRMQMKEGTTPSPHVGCPLHG